MNNEVANRRRYYLKDIAINAIILLLFFFMDSELYSTYSFDVLGKGLLLPDQIFNGLIMLFVLPLVLAIINQKNVHSAVSSDSERIFGVPITFLPQSSSEFFLFNVFLIAGVIFEELICRQFMFISFYQTFGIKGDVLLAFTSFLFSIGHVYQGWKGVIVTFIFGLVLGKVFQSTGTILYPIILHLLSNLTISVIAYKRFKVNDSVNS